MLFTSYEFLIFFLPFVLFVYFVLLKWTRIGQNIFLTFASLCFYAWGEPSFVLVMLFSIFCNWIFALLIDHFRDKVFLSRAILVSMLAVNLGILAVYKYLAFTISNINNLFASEYFVPQIMLPLGISFFTFQAISYVVDVYRRNGEVQKNPLNVALYIAFFPQLIAGPIVRYQTVAEQIVSRKETWDDFCVGSVRFIQGLAKKMIIANNMALVADAAFANPGEISVGMAWTGAIAYTLQIYFDFSAYSDMAIGIGRMFGFKFLENFNYPYIAKSITDFWRRWHISLGTWFRDYVYIPMGGNRVHSKFRFVFNIFTVWLLTGVWHGANWTFIVWGLLYFILLSLEKFLALDKRLSYFSYVSTLFFVIIGWVIFRSADMPSACCYIANMLGMTESPLIDNQVVFYARNFSIIFLLGIIFSLPVLPWLLGYVRKRVSLKVIYTLSVIVMFVVSMSYIFSNSNNPFIYSNF